MTSKRQSSFSKYLSVPEDDPERIQVEQSQWIGGDDAVCQFQLSVLSGRDITSVLFDEYLSELVRFCRERLPSPSTGAVAGSHGHYFARIYLEELRRRAGSTIFGPLKKPEKAVVLLLENPNLTDQEVAKRVPTTQKQLNRFTTYQLLRRELSMAGPNVSRK